MFERLSTETQRGIALLVTAFAVVLLSGVAFAQIGARGGIDETREPVRPAATTDAAPETTAPIASNGAGARTVAEVTTLPAERPPADQPKAPTDDTEPPIDDEEPPVDDTTPPRLAILHPDDGAHTADRTVTVKGETEPGATVTSGGYVADVDAAGYWRIRLSLAIGRNTIVIHATDAAGNTSEASITVIRDERDPKPEPEHEFTAHQKWDTVDAEPVINKYHGTAAPGVKITIASEFGGTETRADDRGKWEAAVTFRDTDCNTSWQVVVAAATRDRAEFRMKRVCTTDTKFTAHQKWDTVDGEPVVNKYHGTAAPGTKIWIGADFGTAETKADDGGEWHVAVTFTNPPCNTPFAVAVESSAGNRAEFKMKWQCETEHEFTAHQEYGSCGEAVPYDIFYGTGATGLEVMVASDWGHGSTVVGADGKWRIKIEFPNAPFDEVFPVKVKSSDGDRADFWFVRTRQGK